MYKLHSSAWSQRASRKDDEKHTPTTKKSICLKFGFFFFFFLSIQKRVEVNKNKTVCETISSVCCFFRDGTVEM